MDSFSAGAGSVSLLHSFYNWGQVAVFLISTAFFALFGTAHWRILTVLWALVPLCNIIYLLKVPMAPLIKEGETGMTIPQLLKNGRFLLLVLLVLCAGAAECGISQWASTFAEAGLGISKSIGDLAGPTCFAIMMGTVRALHGRSGEKYRIEQLMLISGIICLVCYLIASLSPSPSPHPRLALFRSLSLPLCPKSLSLPLCLKSLSLPLCLKSLSLPLG